MISFIKKWFADKGHVGTHGSCVRSKGIEVQIGFWKVYPCGAWLPCQSASPRNPANLFKSSKSFYTSIFVWFVSICRISARRALLFPAIYIGLFERTHEPCVPTCLLSTIHLIIRTNPKGHNSMFKVQRQLIIKVKVQWSKFKGKVPTSHKAYNLSTRLLVNCQPNWLSTTWTLRFKLTHFARQYGWD